MSYVLLHSLPTIVGLAITIGLLILIFLWLGIAVKKERKTIRRRPKNPGRSNRQQRRMEQAIGRQRRKPR